jgi:hypothetical protein
VSRVASFVPFGIGISVPLKVCVTLLKKSMISVLP